MSSLIWGEKFAIWTRLKVRVAYPAGGPVDQEAQAAAQNSLYRNGHTYTLGH
jgi:hypothetical protein